MPCLTSKIHRGTTQVFVGIKELNALSNIQDSQGHMRQVFVGIKELNALSNIQDSQAHEASLCGH